MPFVDKHRPRRTHSTWLGFIRVNKLERPFLPDLVTSVSVPNWNIFRGGRRTIWERAK